MTLKIRKFGVVAAALAVVGASAAMSLAGAGPASADPEQFDEFNLVGVGSDTTQEVLNAMQGFAAGKFYPAVRTTNGQQLLSFDATADGAIDSCIETRTKSASLYRPNGSTEGRRALSRAFSVGGTWGIGACGIKSASGLIDFARSSSGPGSTQTPQNLVYIPFARDALSFGYYSPVALNTQTQLTTAQLTSLFATGPQIINSKLIVPCGIQLGSGTFSFWNTANGIASTEATGTATCNNILGVPGTDGRVQENKGDQLKTKGDLIQTLSLPACDGVAGGPDFTCAGAQVIIGFSASAYVASGNGVSSATFEPTVQLGTITGLGLPVTGTAPALSANSTFYNSGTFGRDVYNVVPKTVIDDVGSIARAMFVGDTSPVCRAGRQVDTNGVEVPNTSGKTIRDFGFLTLGASCGSTSLFGPFIAGIGK